MIEEKYKHRPDLCLIAISLRCRGELNITNEEFQRAEKYALTMMYETNCKVKPMTPIPIVNEAWPEDESRIDIIGSNVNDGLVYSEEKS